MAVPVLYLSSTNADLNSHRERVREILENAGYKVDDVNRNLGPDYRTIETILRERIAAADAVIHIVGFYYGSEPKDQPLEVAPRRSYTQMEYHIARELEKPCFIFILGNDFEFDQHSIEDSEKQQLQEQHRKLLFDQPRFRQFIRTSDELYQHINRLKFPLEREKAQEASGSGMESHTDTTSRLDNLSGPDAVILREAILSAYDRDEFKIFLYSVLDLDFNTVVNTAAPFRTQVFEVLNRARADGRVRELATALIGDRSGNEKVRELARTFDLPIPPPPRPDAPSPALQPRKNSRFSWVHLSDIEWSALASDQVGGFMEALLADLRLMHELTGPWHAVFITGNFLEAYLEKAPKAAAARFRTRFWETLESLGSGKAVLIPVPGASEFTRGLPATLAVDSRLASRSEFERSANDIWDKQDDGHREILEHAFASYTDWWKDESHRPRGHFRKGLLPGDFACTCQVEGRSIGIVALNLMWMPAYHPESPLVADEEPVPAQVWDARQLKAVCGSNPDAWAARHDLCILVTHLGPEIPVRDSHWNHFQQIAPPGRFAIHLLSSLPSQDGDSLLMKLSSDEGSVTRCQGIPLILERLRLEGEGYALGSIEFPQQNRKGNLGRGVLRVWPRYVNVHSYEPEFSFHSRQNMEATETTVDPPKEITSLPIRKPSLQFGRFSEDKLHHEPGYSSDMVAATRESDFLDIADDAEGCARLIASKALHPPLSIGLFGDWGSGKSFFMDLLFKEIDVLAEATRHFLDSPERKEEDAPPAFCGRIVQIKFNAWQYAEANLWASISDHIFSKLHGQDLAWGTGLADPRIQEAKNRDEAAIRTREAAKVAVAEIEQKVKAEKDALDKARAHVEETREAETTQATKEAVLKLTVEQLKPEFQSAVQKVFEAAGMGTMARELGQPLGEVRKTLHDVGFLFHAFLSSTLKIRLLWGVVFLVLICTSLLLWVIPAAAAWVQTFPTLYLIGKYATPIFLPLVWLFKLGIPVLTKIREARKIVDTQIAATKAKVEQDINERQQRLAKLEFASAEAIKLCEKAEADWAHSRAQLQRLTGSRTFGEFILNRALSDDYRKHLGLLAQVKKDFDELGQKMMDRKEKDSHIERIVLYIDDLDRCPEERVVQVLEAVHLLLASRLFVVVVGVDSRWVHRSLARRYPRLLSDGQREEDGARATPRDYVEKIFQIPYWIKPMGTGGGAMLVNGLLPKVQITEKPVTRVQPSPAGSSSGSGGAQVPGSRSAAAVPAGTPPPPVVPGVSPRTSSSTSTPQTGTGGGTSSTAAGVKGKPPITQGGSRKVDLNPKSLDLYDYERDFLQALAPLCRSPRAVKRFVNVYRLLRTSITSEEALQLFAHERDGDFRSVIFLLGLAVGTPSFGWEAFQYIQFADDAHHLLEIFPPGSGNGYTATDPASYKLRSRYSMLDDCLTAIEALNEPYGATLSSRSLKYWLPRVQRYSFDRFDEGHPPSPSADEAHTTTPSTSNPSRAA